jgi:predicted  nucleic acid-binding Zn-ribbon protein
MASFWPLVKLQQVDLEIVEINKKKANLDTGASLEQEAQEAKKILAEKLKFFHDSQKSLKDLELQLATVESHRKKIEDKLFSGSYTNPKELSSWEKEVELLKKQQSSLDDKILPKMDELENLEKELAKLKDEVKDLEERARQRKADYERELQELEDKLKILKDRKEKSKELCDPELLTKYEEIKAKRDGIAVVKVIRNNCGGCFMNLPQGLLKRVQERHLEFCSNCGRILYAEGE